MLVETIVSKGCQHLGATLAPLLWWNTWMKMKRGNVPFTNVQRKLHTVFQDGSLLCLLDECGSKGSAVLPHFWGLHSKPGNLSSANNNILIDLFIRFRFKLEYPCFGCSTIFVNVYIHWSCVCHGHFRFLILLFLLFCGMIVLQTPLMP